MSRRLQLTGLALLAACLPAASFMPDGWPKMAFYRPWFLLLLLLLPVIIAFGFRRLATLGPIRRWLALGLRCALVTLLALALADLRAVHEDERLTVLILLDRSYSIPQEYETAPEPGSAGKLA